MFNTSRPKELCLVQHNLNTHKPASLYLPFVPQEARRLTERSEWHYAPKRGTWLNMGETESIGLAPPMSQSQERKSDFLNQRGSQQGRLKETQKGPAANRGIHQLGPSAQNCANSNPQVGCFNPLESPHIRCKQVSSACALIA